MDLRRPLKASVRRYTTAFSRARDATMARSSYGCVCVFVSATSRYFVDADGRTELGVGAKAFFDLSYTADRSLSETQKILSTVATYCKLSWALSVLNWTVVGGTKRFNRRASLCNDRVSTARCA